MFGVGDGQGVAAGLDHGKQLGQRGNVCAIDGLLAGKGFAIAAVRVDAAHIVGLHLGQREIDDVGAGRTQKLALSMACDVAVEHRIVADHQHIVTGGDHVQLQRGDAQLQCFGVQGVNKILVGDRQGHHIAVAHCCGLTIKGFENAEHGLARLNAPTNATIHFKETFAIHQRKQCVIKRSCAGQIVGADAGVTDHVTFKNGV